MTTPKLLRMLTLIGAPLALGLTLASPALAGTVKGTVRLPDSVQSGRSNQGYWRLENGNVPVRPSTRKSGAVVVLDGVSGARPPAPKTVTVEISALNASPRIVVVGPGSVVEFKNQGKITHELSVPADQTLMPTERLNPGTFRNQKFGVPGGYLVRCSEYPSLAISVIVVDSPYYAVVDERGGFTIPGVPDTKANLKVWAGGRWAYEQSVDTSSKADLSIRVSSSKASKEADLKDAEGKDGEPEAKESDPTKGSAQ
jgi:plastocyanin